MQMLSKGVESFTESLGMEKAIKLKQNKDFDVNSALKHKRRSSDCVFLPIKTTIQIALGMKHIQYNLHRTKYLNVLLYKHLEAIHV